MARSRSRAWSTALLEGAVVVVSILLALLVDEWRGSIRDGKVEQEYLQRLASDLEANLAEITRQSDAQVSQLASARLIYPVIARGDWTGLDTATVVRASYFATPSPTPTWARDTFDELNSTGRMGLITNAPLRAELLGYYRELDARDYTYRLMSTTYRDAVRARMDPDLQLELRGCRPRDPACPVEVDNPTLGSYVRWISSNEALADGLRRVIVQWTRGEEEYLPDVEERTRRLLASVQDELAS